MLYVGLGAWCQVAHQLKRLYGDDFIPCAFDWTVTPLGSVAKVFDTDGEKFGQGFFIAEASKAIECEAYGLLYRHEFRMGEDGVAIYNEDHAIAARAKLQHKHQSLIERLSQAVEPVTFVRYGGHALPAKAWPYLLDQQHVAAAEMNALVASIARALPELEFQVLFIRDNHWMRFSVEADRFDPRVIHATIPHRDGLSWTGHDEDWAAMMASLETSAARLALWSIPERQSPDIPLRSGRPIAERNLRTLRARLARVVERMLM